MHSAAGEIPYEPGLNRAEEQLIRLGERACARDIVKYPLYLCAGEICVYDKTRLVLYVLLHAVRLYLLAELCRAAALPDDGVIDGLSRLPVPHDSGLALIGYADSRYILGLHSARRKDGGQRLKLAEKYLHGVMFNPARSRINLIELLLRFGYNVALLVKNDSSRAGRSLVECKDVFCHLYPSFQFTDVCSLPERPFFKRHAARHINFHYK